MADFRLEVFHTVARRLSFTKAAHELFITQPAVTKHIRELEEQYKVRLFERNGNRIKLTRAGEVLFNHCEQLFDIYRKIEFEMNALVNRRTGILRIGASTTISQYVIPPLLAGFHQKFPDIKITLTNGNTEAIENALIHKEIDLGLIEGETKNQQISYSEFIKDEIVLICRKDHPLARQGEINIDQLKSFPFIIRERGSGTLEVIEHALQSAGIKLDDLDIQIQLGTTEAIKSYLLNSDCIAFMSVYAVSKELNTGEMRIIDVAGTDISRFFYLIHLQGKADGLSEIFIRYARHAHNLK